MISRYFEPYVFYFKVWMDIYPVCNFSFKSMWTWVDFLSYFFLVPFSLLCFLNGPTLNYSKGYLLH